MSLSELISILRNHVQISSDLQDIPVSFPREDIYNNKGILEVELDTLSGTKTYEIQFKQTFKTCP